MENKKNVVRQQLPSFTTSLVKSKNFAQSCKHVFRGTALHIPYFSHFSQKAPTKDHSVCRNNTRAQTLFTWWNCNV